MSKFSKGDIINIRATVDSGSADNGYYVDINGSLRYLNATNVGAMTLVKKAVPPMPKPGTVFRHADVSYGKYIVKSNGGTTFVYDSDGSTSSGVFTWDTMDHSKVTILG